MVDDPLENLKNTVDGYIQRVGALLAELRTAIEDRDMPTQNDTMDSLERELAELKPALN